MALAIEYQKRVVVSGSGDILHVRASVSSTAGVDNYEFWIATTTKQLHYIRRSPGKLGDGVVIRNGNSVVSYDREAHRVLTTTAPSATASMLDNPGPGAFMMFRSMDQGGQGRQVPVGRGIVQGRSALRYEFPIGYDDLVLNMEAWVDEETLLPFSTRLSEPIPGQHGLNAAIAFFMSGQSFDYDIIEYLNADDLPTDFFSAIPASEIVSATPLTHMEDRYMSLSQARVFREFPVYWAGEHPDGLNTATYSYFNELGGLPPMRSRFDIIYGSPFGDEGSSRTDTITLMEQPSELVELYTDHSDAISIVNPDLGLLSGRIERHDYPNMTEGEISVIVGGTTVRIAAKNDFLAKSIVAALRRLNP